MTAPASNVSTTSGFALKVQRTSEGGPTIRNAVAIHATRRENIRATSRNCRHTAIAKQASVVAFSATTLEPATENTAALR